jgi:hypothetical protein
VNWFDDVVDRLEDVLEKGDPGRLWADFLGASNDAHIAERALREAREERLAARDRALAAELAPVLRRDLRKGRNTLTVLHLLLEVGGDHPRLVQDLVPELYECCLSINKAGIWGRDILRTLGTTAHLHTDLAPLVAGTLADEDEVSDFFAMSALRMLLDDLGDTVLMEQWHHAALASPDAEVRELAEDEDDEDAEGAGEEGGTED